MARIEMREVKKVIWKSCKLRFLFCVYLLANNYFGGFF